MFDIGWSEILVIAVIAVVVVGPRDLPRLMRTVGQWVSRGRRMARELQSQFDQALKEADLDDVGKEMTDLSRASPRSALKKAMEPVTSAVDDVRRTVSEAGESIEREAAEGSSDTPETQAKPEAKPAGNGAAAPAGPAPAATDPAETAPVETAPAETAPDEPAPAETAPDEPGPVETGPVETGPAEVAAKDAEDEPEPTAERAAAGS